MEHSVFKRSSGPSGINPPRPALVLWVVIIVVAVIAVFSSSYVIETGNVGVTKTLGTVSLDEVTPGLHLRLPFLTSVDEYSGKENTFDLTDLTPKAADNLSLRDLDVTVFYSTAANKIADVAIKYASSDQPGGGGVLYPGYGLVWREARGAIYEVVAKVDSLQLHKQRNELQTDIQTMLQERLDAQDPQVFNISRVVVRALNTDPSIEQSIQLAVQNQKRLEAKKIEVEIAAKEAEIEVAKAQGIAKANEIINASLTAEYLQHEINLALREFAKNDGQAIVIPANMQGFSIMLNQDRLHRGARAAPAP